MGPLSGDLQPSHELEPAPPLRDEDCVVAIRTTGLTAQVENRERLLRKRAQRVVESQEAGYQPRRSWSKWRTAT